MSNTSERELADIATDGPMRPVSVICWLAAAVLLGFLCFTQLAVMLSLSFGRSGFSWAAPTGLVLALVVGDLVGRWVGLARGRRFTAAGIVLGVVAVALAMSACYFDFSWDGQWYHQTAILRIARDWNPLSDPMNENLIAFTAYFAKGPWYVAAAIYHATGVLEAGKCSTVISWAAMVLAVLAAGFDLGLRPVRAAAVAVVVALNPVVLREMPTFLVDGIMMASLTVVIAAAISGLNRPRLLVIVVGILAAVVCLNAKLNSVVGLGIVIALGGVWCAVNRPAWLPRFVGIAVLAVVLGAGVFGFNPYLTNTIHKHNPLYPTLSTNRLELSNERTETPKNLLSRNIAVRLAYSIFGRPDNPPYTRPDAKLMVPFDVRAADLSVYRFQDPRVGALGPFFGGAVILAAILFVWMLFQPRMPRWAAAVGMASLVASLLIAPVLWWPRFAPQQWWLAVLPLVFVFWRGRSPWLIRTSGTLAALLIVNAAIVAVAGFAWETNASHRLRQQLAGLRDSGRTIEVDCVWFQLAARERLDEWGVHYRALDPSVRMKDGTELMSVSEGYPMPVRYRVLPAER